VSRPVAFLLLILLWPGALPAAAAQDFLDGVAQRAQALAAEPYRRAAPVPEAARIGYDAYRAIRFRPESVLWRDSAALFRVEFFPTGFLYEHPVKMNVVSGAGTGVVVRPIEAAAEMFDFGKAGPPKALALAGFKVTYPLHGEKRDEVVSFLGASYFRPVGRGQVYGASARGLAIDTAQPKSEEFPEFREFWLVEPTAADRALTIYAVLDSPSAAGAYRFIVRPGTRTVVETDVRLFPRQGVGVLGMAPLTSMFLAGKAGPSRDDFRPEVHDSDGLAMLTGKGERIWRPLANPGALAVSTFTDNNPRGFGLLQRERRFERYQDAPAGYQARPGLWVEPDGDWGEGEVRLVEIPTPSEFHDNIVAFWVSKWPVAKDKPLQWRYRVSALKDEAALSAGAARVVALRQGSIDGAKGRRIVIEFEGGDLTSLGAEQVVESNVAVSSGKMLRTVVERTPDSTNRRLLIDIEPEGGRRPIDIRASLTLQGIVISETLSHVLRP
jgi:periplasmic glucans biosynthesis protein